MPIETQTRKFNLGLVAQKREQYGHNSSQPLLKHFLKDISFSFVPVMTASEPSFSFSKNNPQQISWFPLQELEMRWNKAIKCYCTIAFADLQKFYGANCQYHGLQWKLYLRSKRQRRKECRCRRLRVDDRGRHSVNEFSIKPISLADDLSRLGIDLHFIGHLQGRGLE